MSNVDASLARNQDGDFSRPLETTSDAQTIRTSSEDRKYFLIAVALVGAIFLLLENQYWVPGGDSETYLGSAINLLKGNGFMFCGQAMRISPPGWPWVLALLIKISPTFLFLKLVTLAFMWAGLATYYWVLRRFASPKIAAASIVLTALLSYVYSLTFWLHSDAMFVLITAVTVLLCLQISEGRRASWRLALLGLLAIAAVLNRWAAIVNLALVAGALLQGQKLKPKLTLPWIAAGSLIVLTILTLFITQRVVNHYGPAKVPYEGSGSVETSAIPPMEISDSANVSDTPGLLGIGGKSQTGLVTRVLGFGTWLSYLLWQPFRMAGGMKIVWYAATACGWLVFIFLIAGARRATLARHWLLAAVLLYVIGLDLRWPQANARYLVPIAPLLVMMIFLSLSDWPVWIFKAFERIDLGKFGLFFLQQWNRLPERVRQWLARDEWKRVTWIRLGQIGIASIVLCNAALYAVEVRIARSSRFADLYEAGINKNLVAASEYLRAHHAGHWQVCVNPEVKNLNKRRLLPTGLRIISMLTGKGIWQLPSEWIADPKVPNSPPFRKKFIARYKVIYYLEQPDVMTWRVWHFKVPSLEKFYLEHFEHLPMPTNRDDSGWKLYRCNGAETPVLVPLPMNVKFPTRVPGF